MSQLWSTYHNQLDGEVGALGTDVGDVATRLKETLPVAASLRARHLKIICQTGCIGSGIFDNKHGLLINVQLTQTDFFGS